MYATYVTRKPVINNIIESFMISLESDSSSDSSGDNMSGIEKPKDCNYGNMSYSNTSKPTIMYN